MPARLDPSPTAPRSRARSVGARLQGAALEVLQWTPVWVPAAFLAQLLVSGWFPALSEAARLDAAEAEVRGRVQALEDERDALSDEARMLEDGIYRERVRRSLLDPATAPLTLERARPDARP